MGFVVTPYSPPSAIYVPFAPEIAAKYTLTGPDGTVATFNDQTDPNWCGTLSDVTGLDSADVRESADVLVQTDGGWHGNFWFGRRPITISGVTTGNVDAAARALKLDKIRRASNAMRADSILSWQNNAAGSVPMQTWVRRQQPLRFTGGYAKNFQMLLISQFAPLFSTNVHTPSSFQNLIPNPSFEADTLGSAAANYTSSAAFNGVGGTMTTNAVQNSWSSSGTKSLRMTITAMGASDNGGIFAPMIPVTSNQQYNLSATINLLSASAGASVGVYFEWYTAGSALISTTGRTSVPLGVSTTNIQATAPSNATQVRAYVMATNGGSGGGSVDFYVDAVQFTQSTAVLPYADATGLGAINLGDYPSAPVIRIYGPTSDTIITSTTSGAVLKFLPGFAVASGNYVDVDILNHTATLNGVSSMNSWIDFTNTTWPLVLPGNNTFTFAEGSGGGATGGRMMFTYRDTWT